MSAKKARCVHVWGCTDGAFTLGKIYTELSSRFYNGEHWSRFVDDNGDKIEIPSIFFDFDLSSDASDADK